MSQATDGLAAPAKQENVLPNGIKVHIGRIIRGDQNRGNAVKVFIG